MSKTVISRRTFESKALVISLSCVFGKAVSATQPLTSGRGGRPPLTVSALNELSTRTFPARGTQLDRAGVERAALAQRDWQAVLTREFAMTPQQLANLRAMPRSEVILVQKAIAEAAIAGEPMRFKVVDGASDGAHRNECPRPLCRTETVPGPKGELINYKSCGLRWTF